MLKVQQFIEEHDIDALTRDYGITVKQYETERVAVFNYDMIDSPKTDPIVAECRGLILSMDDCSVVSRSFDRFFNFGEAGSESFDFMGKHNGDADAAFAQLNVNKQIDLLCKWVRPLVVDELYPHVEINGNTYHATDNDQFIYPLVHKGEYIPTTTCLCYAHSWSECCCGAWAVDD